jgi:type IV secretory pathway VirB2 component (pilin)
VDVANILAFAAAVIAVIIVMVAGITMMTSDGDAGKIASSRNAIIYTVVGLIIIIAARSIVVFVMLKVAT